MRHYFNKQISQIPLSAYTKIEHRGCPMTFLEFISGDLFIIQV